MKRQKILALLAVLPVFLLSLGCSLANQNQSGPQPALAKSIFEGIKEKRGSGSVYRFIAFGDWGTGNQFQKDIARQMALQYEKEPYDAALLLGDNIYEVGDIKKHGKAYFTDMYAPLIKNGVNFIVALGNHDVVMGHGAEQVAFFKMPGYYYTVHKPKLDIFVINTNTFAKDAIQQQWLKKELAGTHTPWKIVMGHHPIYSSGEHGNNAGLHQTLEPLLVKNAVDMYLAGHDHDYERFKSIEGVQHIVSGGGGAYLRNFEKPVPNSLVRLRAHHFLNFELTKDTLHMWVIDTTGKVIDQAEWSKLQRNQLQTGLKAGTRS